MRYTSRLYQTTAIELSGEVDISTYGKTCDDLYL